MLVDNTVFLGLCLAAVSTYAADCLSTALRAVARGAKATSLRPLHEISLPVACTEIAEPELTTVRTAPSARKSPGRGPAAVPAGSADGIGPDTSPDTVVARLGWKDQAELRQAL